MLKRFEKHIKDVFPFLEEANLLIACSGGLDSMVLTHLLKELGFSMSIAHCNFSLRGAESDGDEDFVSHFAQDHRIPFYTKKFDTKAYAASANLSTQMAARELRYDWFSYLLKQHQLDYVLTAHHADDTLETFFINLSRGTGIRGLTGIPAINGSIIRPLLPFSRASILKYAKDNELFWREDSSNSKKEYLRNKIRHDLIPSFKALGNQVTQNFERTQNNLNQTQALVNDYMQLVYNLVVTESGNTLHIHIPKLKELPNTDALLYELVFAYGFSDFEAIKTLLTAQSGKQVFSRTHRLLKNREDLILSEYTSDIRAENHLIFNDTMAVDEPISMNMSDVPGFEITNANSIFVDKDLLKFPLLLRKWQEGDSIYPFGMKGKKKLSKLFKDEKLSLIAKENTWVLCSDDRIVWVVGVRMDDRFKVTKDTNEILRIDYTPR